MYSEILPYLFVGSYHDALMEPELLGDGITHILNVRDSINLEDVQSFQFLHVPVSDYGDSKLNVALEECCAFIEAAKAESGKVLVHCAQGQNRSPCVVVGYLLLKHSMSLREAYFLMRARRPQFAPHEGYFKQLQEMEMKLRGKVSLIEKEEEDPLTVQGFIRKMVTGGKEEK